MKINFALLAALLVGVSASGCSDICSNEPVADIPSPSGKNKAIVFHRNCGADTAPNTQVAVIPAYSTLPNIPGNALILDGDVPLEVRWISDAALSVRGLTAVRVSKQRESVADVSIAYAK